MMRTLAAIALVGSLGLLAVTGLGNLRDQGDWVPGPRHVVRKVVRDAHWSREEAREIRRQRRSRDVHSEAVAGAYEFSESGSIFGKLPWSAHAVLTLKPAGRYVLDLDITVDGDHEAEASEGEYRVEGDRVILVSESGDPGLNRVLEEHALRIQNGRLIPDVRWPARAALGAAGVEDLAFEKLK